MRRRAAADPEEAPVAPWRARLHDIIFEAETPAGRLFDLALLACILLSVTAVVLESIAEVRARHGAVLRAAEWAFTGLFSVEYGLRLLAVRRPARYAGSFFGVIDLLAVLPTYLSVLLPGAQSLLVVRALRLLRVFRILKLMHFVAEGRFIMTALRASLPKVTVFIGAISTLMLVIGAVMYLVEGPASGFTSIPRSVYWAIVTVTTVGYGDITPRTPLGQVIAATAMILGYAIIAVPTGIVTAEVARGFLRPVSTRACPGCGGEGHETTARHCKHCGARLDPPEA